MLMNETKKLDATTLVGKYIKTIRNEAVERIFEDAGFNKSTGDNGTIFWGTMNLAREEFHTIQIGLTSRLDAQSVNKGCA